MYQYGNWPFVFAVPHHGRATNEVATVRDPASTFEKEEMLRLILARWIETEQDESRICTIIIGADQPINKFRDALETSSIGQPHVPIEAWTVIPKTGNFRPTGVLRLSLDEKRHRVRREGYEEVVDLGGKNLPWALLLVFIANPELPLSKEVLKNVWEEHGREPNPQLGSVVSEVKKLARRLGTLGLAIPCTTLLGYRLVDAANGKAR